MWLWFSCVCPTVMCHGSYNAHQRRTTLEDATYQWLLDFFLHLLEPPRVPDNSGALCCREAPGLLSPSSCAQEHLCILSIR